MAAASDQGEEVLVRLLDELWQRRVLVAQPAQVYDFSHDHIREAAYALIGPVRRTHLHHRIAQALEHVYGDDLDMVAAQLAAHYEQAGLAEKAVGWHQRAAEVHRRLYAHNEAIADLHAALELLRTLPATHGRDHQELALLLALNLNLVIARGVSASEVGFVLEQARDLAARLNERRQLFYVVRNLLVFYMAGRSQLIARKLALQLPSLARALANNEFRAEAYRCLAQVHGHLGEFVSAHRYMTAAMKLLPDGPIVDTAFPVDGFDFRWSYYANASQYLWALGHMDQARIHIDKALMLVAAGVHAFALVNACFYAAILYRNLGDYLRVTTLAKQMLALGDKYGLPLARLNGSTFQGWVMAVEGDLKGGIAQIEPVFAELRALGHTMYIPYRLTLLAELQIQAGQLDAAAAMLAEARSVSEQFHGHSWDAEVHRLQGELLLAQAADPLAVERCYRRALDIARTQQAKSLELRAALSLARLWHRQGRSAEARQLLAETYSWFREGFDTADLQTARSLLDQLSSPA
jgi:predicted ATPase